jgi:hypothetical protein
MKSLIFSIEEGDYGSLVVDPSNGNVYGHIVAGNIGTGFAYIVLRIARRRTSTNVSGSNLNLLPPKITNAVPHPKQYQRLAISSDQPLMIPDRS